MLTLRYMRPEDIPVVVELDQRSFPNAWSERSYNFEVRENKSSHMVVLEIDSPATIIGFAGTWLIEDETHISTIAISAEQRGNGYGEILLAGLLDRSIALGATYAVLEVRISNGTAINLYRKYEFEVVHRRKNYYRDNNEDAYMMFLNGIDAGYKARFADRLAKLRQRVHYTNLLPSGKPTFQ
ncbi:MAG: ribosomal protein S18-alanine N-acetyltransferase [Anaerolineae bacterium]|nr:ribosomal protein S18-alanine N-acetyltransferase [Anaerolineae bacterium]